MKKSKNKFLVPLILVISLFFLWAFLHNINPILIPHLKKACQLNDTQSSYIDLAVYISYFLVALPAGWLSHKYGYKKGIIFGLSLYAIGALLVIPAANERSYAFFLFAFFVIAAGATFLETIANPYVSVLGDPETSERRLNFAQSFNGVGSFIAPILGGQFILSGIEYTPEELNSMSPTALNQYLQFEANTIKGPYLIIAGVVIVLLLLFVFIRIPEVKEDDQQEGEVKSTFSIKVFRHRHFSWAVISQFFYVAAQVGVGSFFIRYAKEVSDMNERSAAFFWGSVAMVGFMVGRFFGTFLMNYIKASKLLAIYSVINIALLIIALSTSGNTALYALVATPFFMSIMYPTIFALGIKGLGAETKVASSFLVMAILGGAIGPLFMGLVSDRSGSMQTAYIIPMLCFAVILYYAIWGYKIKTVNEII
jgi:FHS family L-fucose permease-like MFS transporter